MAETQQLKSVKHDEVNSPKHYTQGKIEVIDFIQDQRLDYVEGNITASIDYDVQNAFGLGNTNFYVSEMTDDEWKRDYKQYIRVSQPIFTKLLVLY